LAAPATPSANAGGASSASYAADDAGIDSALRSGKFWTVIGVFFAAGILLSLTPCVLPMLPILSSIIVGHGAQVSRGRGLSLAASYSLGMALVYTALGVAAGLAGEGLAAALQKPWVLTLFAAGLIALSLSMFGVYELQLPSALTSRLSNASQRLPAGRFAGVFAMGGLSALIVSPCVAAPLAGALVYLSQTRDVWLGGTALFSLAAGMSVPLLLMGASAGALLPRAGGWMDEVKRFFGVLLLAVALWTVQSVLPASLVLALWGALAVAAAVMLASHHHGHRLGWTQSLWRRAIAAVLAVCGLLQLVGAASGGSNPLQPLAHLRAQSGVEAAAHGPVFTTVRSVAELDAALLSAGRPVMLDFYADWCVSCKEMEKFTFTDPRVREKFARMVLLQIDVTANNADDKAMLKRFQLFGPPGIILFDSQGRELAGKRVIGYQNADQFLQSLQALAP
jgi:thiol:disulfide interchange protein DsbD